MLYLSLVDFYIGDEADKPGYALKVRVWEHNEECGMECGMG